MKTNEANPNKQLKSVFILDKKYILFSFCDNFNKFNFVIFLWLLHFRVHYIKKALQNWKISVKALSKQLRKLKIIT